jgi:hypothetical protein
MADPIDEIIRQAMQRGDFDNLPNKGKKLNLDEYFEMPEDVRVGYTMLKGADFVPVEVELLKEIAALEESLKNAQTDQQEKIRKEIREKRLKYNLLLESGKKSRG